MTVLPASQAWALRRSSAQAKPFPDESRAGRLLPFGTAAEPAGYFCHDAGSTEEYQRAEIERRFNAPRRARNAEHKRADNAGHPLYALPNPERGSPKLLSHQLCEQAHR